MTNCYGCNTPGRHIALIMPRDATQETGVVHECTNPECPILRWEEVADESLIAVAKAWSRDPDSKTLPRRPAP